MAKVLELFILKLEPDLNPEHEKLSEHGAWLACYPTINK